MVIDASETKVFKRAGTQRLDETVARGGHIDLAASHLFEEILQMFV